MGCGTCGSGSCSTSGCGQKGGCATGGCNKLNTYDWLNNMLSPEKSEADNIYEVRFKNTRKGFYRNVNSLRLYIGDTVVVESDRGYDIGVLSLGGIMAELQMRRKGGSKVFKEIPRIYRKANEGDIEQIKLVREREQPTLVRSREIILEQNLDMKLSDVEYQGDNAKAIFYYIADHRVDFRELIKVLAKEFRIRVEMKQIGLRHEAGLVGGIGSCGRELCCSTWLTDFKTVSTSAARYQNLSLNPMKISGLCGRLKCCLNFELDAYMDALEGFPNVEVIETGKGRAILQKTDIFKGKMWFSYPNETTWYPMTVSEVKEIVAMNAKGKKPDALSTISQAIETEPEFDFVDVVGTELPAREQQSRKPNQNQNQRNKKKNNSNNNSSNSNNNSSNSNNNSSNSNNNNNRNNPKRNFKKKPNNPDAKSSKPPQPPTPPQQ